MRWLFLLLTNGILISGYLFYEYINNVWYEIRTAVFL